MPDGSAQAPGGWNRFAIEVKEITSMVAVLRKAGVHFRNEIVNGMRGKQIIVEDPSRSPVKLFEPTILEARTSSAE